MVASGTGLLSVQELASKIDHTNLSPAATQQDIARLCAEAVEHRFAAVCVSPVRVVQAVSVLRSSGVAVCAVVAFPSGAHPVAVKAAEAEMCIRDGAQEIDVVANAGWLRDGCYDAYADDIRTVRRAVGDSAVLKVIIESALLDEAGIVRAGILAAEAGADYVKTSTGVYGRARLEDVILLRRSLPRHVRIKAAGGIRTAESACAMIAAGAERLGTSAGVGILAQLRSD